MARNNNHPWINDLGKSILTQPFFELTDFIEWNEEIGKFYEKVNDTDDERSFVLLLAIIMEFLISYIHFPPGLTGYCKLASRVSQWPPEINPIIVSDKQTCFVKVFLK